MEHLEEIEQRTSGILYEHWEDAREHVWQIARDFEIEDCSQIDFGWLARLVTSEEEWKDATL